MNLSGVEPNARLFVLQLAPVRTKGEQYSANKNNRSFYS